MCCEDDDLVKKVGVDGSHEDEVVMGCAGWVGSKSDNTVSVMATNRQTILETVPDTGVNSQCSSSQQDVPHCDKDSDWQDWRSAHLCVGGQRVQSMRRSLLCAVSQLIPQWMLTFSWSVVGVVRSCA